MAASHRLLISVTEEEHRLLRRAAKAEGDRFGMRIPVATWIRRAAVLSAKALLEGQSSPMNRAASGEGKEK